MKIRDFESLISQSTGVEAINKLFSCKGGDKGISAVLVLRLSYFQEKLQSILRAYVKAKEELIGRFAIRDDQGNIKTDDKGGIMISPSRIMDFNKDFNEFLATDVDEALGLSGDNVFNRLGVSFEDIKIAIEENQLSPNDITPCLPFLKIVGFEYTDDLV